MIKGIKNIAKNLIGWRTSKKIIVFSVDDYGNVRLDSNSARNKMDNAGMKTYSRFDAYDTLETKQDLEMLYQTLLSVKDKNNRPAVFTVFALPCNIDFERIEKENYSEYQYELLTDTFNKLSAIHPQAYTDAWKLWQYGIDNKIFIPQFHGREHLNVKVFNEKLKSNDVELLTSLNNRSFTSISSSGYDSISYTAAFDFENFRDNEMYPSIIEDGLKAFEIVFGFKASHFTPPVYNLHSSLFPYLKKSGIKYVDLAMIQKEHQGSGKYKTKINYLGKSTQDGLLTFVRNVVFEPTDDRGIDWVGFTLEQIETAFAWNRPAIISSHRVNFCGHINPDNRNIGITALSELLRKIVTRWPDVEFMSANELGDIISSKKNIL
jgi:hypothetical protein